MTDLYGCSCFALQQREPTSQAVESGISGRTDVKSGGTGIQSQVDANAGKSTSALKDLLTLYGCLWFFIIADSIVKILIWQGYPTLFDAVLTMLCLVLRSVVNLAYGLELQFLFK